MNPAIENLINELKGYGLDDNKINALMALAYEDFMADFKLDLEKLSDQDMAQLEGQFKNMRVNELLNSKENPTTKILQKVYGMSAQSKIENFLIEYFQDAVNQAKEAKDMLTKLQNNDPELMEEIKKVENDPNKAAIDEAIKIASEI